MWQFNIDVVGGCNLSCPSCPVGNSDYSSVPKGYMKPAMLSAIVSKAKAECGDISVALYNWTEPFLHPQLADMVQAVTGQNVACSLSSNLNIIRNEDAVLSAGLSWIRVSVSGFGQERYERTHRDGDINAVKRNMVRMSEAKQRTGSPTNLEIIFHRYIDNGEDELAMREYAGALGFEFKVVWAYLMPVEKVIEYAMPGAGGATITDDDRTVIGRLALRLGEALEVSREASKDGCRLQDHEFAITVRGEAMLCCGTYDQSKYSVGSFLDLPLAELQRRRHTYSICNACVKSGTKALGLYEAGTKLDEIAFAAIRLHNPSAVELVPMMREKKKRLGDPLRPWVYGLRDGLRAVRRAIRAP